MMKKRNIFITLILMIVLGAYVAYYLYNKPMDKLSDLESNFKITAKDLYVHFDQNEEEATKKYLEKVIEVTGMVDSCFIDPNGGMIITLSTEGEMGAISCEMDTNLLKERKIYNKGEVVCIKGMCSGKLIDVVLNRCVKK